jgi:long-chain fatty acid transport protein
MFWKRWLGGATLMGLCASPAMAQGIIFPSTGAKHRAMAGASTAAPIDAAGATYWNPAVMAAMEDGEVFIGVDSLYANTFLFSSVEATGAFGESRSDSGLSPSPSFAVVTRPENSRFTYGVGVYGFVGRTIDFPGSEFNPVLKPYDPPRSFGFGPISSKTSGLIMTPMMSRQLNDLVALGVGATVTSISLSFDPALFTERNANGLFPPATQGRSNWGFGYQFGVLLTPSERWNFGASFKSRQFFESFQYHSKDEKGNAKTLSMELEFPWILSFGVAYRGEDNTFLENTLVAVDARYLDYNSTKLFGDESAEGGLGWTSIWAFAVGFDRRLNDMIAVQGGFSMNGDPIPDSDTIFNIQVPAINQFAISGGATVALTERVDVAGSVVYGFQHTIAGTILQIPGTLIELRQDLWTFNLGLIFGL